MAAADPSPKTQDRPDPSREREAQPADADEITANRANVDRQHGQTRPTADGVGVNPRRQQRSTPRPPGATDVADGPSPDRAHDQEHP